MHAPKARSYDGQHPQSQNQTHTQTSQKWTLIPQLPPITHLKPSKEQSKALQKQCRLKCLQMQGKSKPNVTTLHTWPSYYIHNIVTPKWSESYLWVSDGDGQLLCGHFSSWIIPSCPWGLSASFMGILDAAFSCGKVH